MRIVGIIAEYNPFHNGHQYHIKKSLELTGADAAIVIMSGDFVQRGAPAILPKHLRAQMALKGGASLVIELPVPYATGSAEYFAYGAVSLFNKLGCIDALCFGSECGDLESLKALAEILVDEPLEYKELLAHYLKQGNTFPLARQYAMRDYLHSEKVNDILAEPNNILGIEYLKALYRLNSNIEPYTIQRISSHYHDQELQESYSSASAIRNVIKSEDFESLKSQLSKESFEFMKENYQVLYPIYTNDLSLLLKYCLLHETKETLTQYTDVSEELANRIMNRRNEYVNYEQFCELLKTKELTYARISRALLHILLNIKNNQYTQIEYARILGFRKCDSDLFSLINKMTKIPLVTKLSAYPEFDALQLDILAADLYESVITDKFGIPFRSEYTQQIIRE